MPYLAVCLAGHRADSITRSKIEHYWEKDRIVFSNNKKALCIILNGRLTF